MVKNKTILFIHIIALTLLFFSYWGLFTSGGRKEFDEMDGIIPVFAGFIGFLIYLGLFIRFIYFWFKKTK